MAEKRRRSIFRAFFLGGERLFFSCLVVRISLATCTKAACVVESGGHAAHCRPRHTHTHTTQYNIGNSFGIGRRERRRRGFCWLFWTTRTQGSDHCHVLCCCVQGGMGKDSPGSWCPAKPRGPPSLAVNTLGSERSRLRLMMMISSSSPHFPPIDGLPLHNGSPPFVPASSKAILRHGDGVEHV